MIKLRQLGELLAQFVAAKSGVKADSRNKDQRTLIDELYNSITLPPQKTITLSINKQFANQKRYPSILNMSDIANVISIAELS